MTETSGHTTKFCFACRASLDLLAEICPSCGVRQPWQAGMPGQAPGAGPVAASTRADAVPIRHVDHGQDQASLQKVARDVAKILTPNEEILYIAVQNATAASIRKDSVVVTSNRIIGFSPGVLGRVSFHDYLWQDVLDVSMKQGFLSTEIVIETAGGKFDIGSIHKDQAKRLYGLAQQLEQEWREKRRVREMEQDRARAGGVYLGNVPGLSAAPAPVAAATVPSADPVSKLAQAKAMLEQGLISEIEYETLKAKILSEF